MDPVGESGHDDLLEAPVLHRLAVGAILVAAALLVTAAAVATAGFAQPRLADAAPHRVADGVVSSAVFLRECGGTAVQQPMTIAGWCASGDDLYSNLQWTSWDATRAVGVGTWFRNSCDCAGGRIERYPVRLTLRAPRFDHGVLRFTIAQAEYPAARPSGAPQAEEFHLTVDGFVRAAS